MDLYLVRHGIAEPRGEKPDDERALASKGVKETTRIAQGLEKLDCRPDIIATSPLPRAAETADVMRDILCPGKPVDVQKFLAPGASASDLVEWLGGLEERSVMVVGHNPDMPAMIAELIAENGNVEIEFKKAAVCLVTFNGRPQIGKGTLRWLMQPGQLCLLGAS